MSKIETTFLMLLLYPLVGIAQESIANSDAIEQQAPIPVELFIGHRALSYQHVLSRNILKEKFNFFNVSAIDAEYGENPKNEFVISSLISYNIGKGFSVGLGGEIQPPGASLIVGAQYAYASKQFLLVIFPSVNLNGPTTYSQFSLLEYRPRINKNLSGYFRTQLVVSTNFEIYDRGYQQFRLGVQLKDLQFGLAANFDQFNSNERTTSNYGLFTRLLIF